jgi:hypothetical protein
MAVGDVKIFIHRIWTVYKPDPTDGSKLVGVDMIDFGPITQIDRSRVVCTVSSLTPAGVPDSGNPAIQMAHDIWERIQPAYRAFKAGQELPEDGTPLAAWNGVSPEQAIVLKTKGLRTVESVADMGDGMLERIGLPGMRDIIRGAKSWLEARDQNKVATKLQHDEREREVLRATIGEQNEQIAEMQKMLAELMARPHQESAQPAPRAAPRRVVAKRKPAPKPAPQAAEPELAT